MSFCFSFRSTEFNKRSLSLSGEMFNVHKVWRWADELQMDSTELQDQLQWRNQSQLTWLRRFFTRFNSTNKPSNNVRCDKPNHHQADRGASVSLPPLSYTKRSLLLMVVWLCEAGRIPTSCLVSAQLPLEQKPRSRLFPAGLLELSWAELHPAAGTRLSRRRDGAPTD